VGRGAGGGGGEKRLKYFSNICGINVAEIICFIAP